MSQGETKIETDGKLSVEKRNSKNRDAWKFLLNS